MRRRGPARQSNARGRPSGASWNHLATVPAKRLGTGIESYFSNQGLGPWELNLAAFLRDLNTNAWAENGFGYEYISALNTASRGLAFEDSLTLLNHRYNGSYAKLASVQNLFGPVGAEFFRQLIGLHPRLLLPVELRLDR